MSGLRSRPKLSISVRGNRAGSAAVIGNKTRRVIAIKILPESMATNAFSLCNFQYHDIVG